MSQKIRGKKQKENKINFGEKEAKLTEGISKRGKRERGFRSKRPPHVRKDAIDRPCSDR